VVRLDVWIFPRGGDYGEEELQAGRDRLEVAAGERAHRERNQDSRCRVRTLGVTQVTVLSLAYLRRDAQIVVESWRGQTSGEQSTLSIDPG
jgi:hypothetical protein